MWVHPMMGATALKQQIKAGKVNLGPRRRAINGAHASTIKARERWRQDSEDESYEIIHIARRPTTKQHREAEVSKEIADDLTRTGFRSLGDALAFYAGSAAPPRSEGMIELRKVENGTSTAKPDAMFDQKKTKKHAINRRMHRLSCPRKDC